MRYEVSYIHVAVYTYVYTRYINRNRRKQISFSSEVVAIFVSDLLHFAIRHEQQEIITDNKRMTNVIFNNG